MKEPVISVKEISRMLVNLRKNYLNRAKKDPAYGCFIRLLVIEDIRGSLQLRSRVKKERNRDVKNNLS